MAALSENDGWLSLNIQLQTVAEDRGYHRKNDGDEIQRPDVVDDFCRGLLLQVRIDRIVHGCEMESHHRNETKKGNPATLIVFGFRFHGIDEKRRFRRAVVTILFQDEKKRDRYDPEVIALWPDGDFTLGKPTIIDVEETKGGEAGTDIGTAEAKGQALWKWERKMGFQKSGRATLTGTMALDGSIREYGPNNAVRLTIKENDTTASGLVTEFRAAVLLRRKNDSDRFLGSINVDATGSFCYNAVQGIRNLIGSSPPNDPVIFQPGNNYLRPPTLVRYLGANLATELDVTNLNADVLDSLVGVIATRVLATSDNNANEGGSE